MNEQESAKRILGRNPHDGPNPVVITYDFHRPDKFTRDQIRTMSIIHETLSRQATTRLSALFGCSADIRVAVACIDQLNFTEALETMPEHSLIGIFSLAPLKGACLLGMDNRVSTAMIDMLGGGSGVPTAEPHELTVLETRMLGAVCGGLIGGFSGAIWFVDGMTPRLVSTETDPRFCQIVPPTEMVLYAELSVHLGAVVGSIRLVYPYLTLEPILEKLTAGYWYRRTVLGDRTPNGIANRLPLSARIRLDLAPMSVAEAGRIVPGSRIEIPPDAFDRLSIAMNGASIGGFAWKEPQNGTGIVLGRARPLEGSPCSEPAVSADPYYRKSAELLAKILEAVLRRSDADSSLSGAVTTYGSTGSLSSVPDSVPDSVPASPNPHGTAAASDPLSDLPRTAGPPLESGGDEEEWISDPFTVFTVEHAESIFIMLSHEHPQTQAAVVSRLNPPLAADFVSRLAADRRVEVMKRVAEIGASPEFVLEIYRSHLSSRLISGGTAGTSSAGGIERLVEILSYSPREVERQVIEEWDRTNPELAEEIKKRLFVFEDIVLLDASAMKKLHSQVSTKDFSLALKNAAKAVLDHIAVTLGEDTASELAALASELGPVRLKDVDAAQIRIVSALQELEKSGEVFIGRAGEMVE